MTTRLPDLSAQILDLSGKTVTVGGDRWHAIFAGSCHCVECTALPLAQRRVSVLRLATATTVHHVAWSDVEFTEETR